MSSNSLSSSPNAFATANELKTQSRYCRTPLHRSRAGDVVIMTNKKMFGVKRKGGWQNGACAHQCDIVHTILPLASPVIFKWIELGGTGKQMASAEFRMIPHFVWAVTNTGRRSLTSNQAHPRSERLLGDRYRCGYSQTWEIRPPKGLGVSREG